MLPRERYLHLGPDDHADADLLSLILGTGPPGRPARRIAEDLLHQFASLSDHASAEPAELAVVPGVGLARAIRVHAALHLGRRSRRDAPQAGRAVRSVDDAAQLLVPGLAGLDHEELHALYLDRRHQPLALRVLTRGSDAFTVVDPRQIFRVAVRLGASCVVLAHNHPSGDPTPSVPDIDVTRRVDRSGKVLGIRLLDHLVVGAGRTVSLAEEGVLQPYEHGPLTTASV